MPPAPGAEGTGAPRVKTSKTADPVEKSYLTSAVESMNPWNTGRSSTPVPKDREKKAGAASAPKANPATSRKADDHSLNTLYGQSVRKYPRDCPPLEVMWFHAVDIPKRKPKFLKSKKKPEETKPMTPKKFVAFTTNDTRSIEAAYQKLLEELEDGRGKGFHKGKMRSDSRRSQNRSIDDEPGAPRQSVRVPVNEDFLFDVDIQERELAPAYWLGPIYEVRRGSWFYQEGSTLRPCEENLAAQLEEGYLKTKPWTYPADRVRSRSNSRPADVTPKASRENLAAAAAAAAVTGPSTAKPEGSDGLGTAGAGANQLQQHQPQTYRLFGTYMNSIATYQDASTAWLSSESMLSWVTASVYQRFAGGSYMSGVKLVRGYSNSLSAKPKDDKRPATPTTATMPPQRSLSEREQKKLKRRSAPPLGRSDSSASNPEVKDVQDSETSGRERREDQLKKDFSSYMENSSDPEKQEESIRKREEQEIQDDYNAQAGETQGREIEHLVLVTHGIGQLLGFKMESVNFVHDVNILRKTLKGVYSQSADLRALNTELGDGPGNCRIQVLPVCWRHLLDFPKRREKKKDEHDLGTTYKEEEDEYPSLEDITIEGVAFARSLISDLALDVLLYQSAYREQISIIVLEESNRIYKLFRERNPEFKGKVHIMGHSLGSAIMFDILCRQKEAPKHPEELRNPLRFWPSAGKAEPPKDPKELAFDFNVDDFYCLGSPVGLFQMLKGRTIGARHLPNSAPTESPLNPEYINDPFLAAETRVSPITGLPYSISSPKVAQLFNIFHPSDPISYRMEPLISPAMSSLKPQALPYTKKGIFDAMAPQGLSGFGVKVGQSVSGLWSSISGGIASSILNRSLGLTSEEVAKFQANSTATTPLPVTPGEGLPPGAGTNIVSGGVISDTTAQSERSAARKKALAAARQNSSASIKSLNGPENQTLIDDELETLFSQFQKKRIEEHKLAASRAEEGIAMGDAWAAEEQKAHKLRDEEQKVRALNLNGRVDYNIQESVLDFNPINTIASHMAYWSDEDVSHFVMSQLLANRSRPSASKLKRPLR